MRQLKDELFSFSRLPAKKSFRLLRSLPKAKGFHYICTKQITFVSENNRNIW